MTRPAHPQTVPHHTVSPSPAGHRRPAPTVTTRIHDTQEVS